MHPACGLAYSAVRAALAQVERKSRSRPAGLSRLVVQGTFDPETLAEFNTQGSGLRRAAQSPRSRDCRHSVVTDNADDIERFERTSRRADSSTRAGRGAARLFIPAMDGQIEADARRSGRRRRRLRPSWRTARASSTSTSTRRIRRDRPLGDDAAKHSPALPDLPRDIEYRFVGRHLILSRRARQHDRRRDPLRPAVSGLRAEPLRRRPRRRPRSRSPLICYAPPAWYAPLD